ncbi:UmoD [Xenorhabdus nematophila]|uniref:UmoD n=1 Tax=Xenorhabdus nematophila (strain ATCC 19061 / DSM 3370 / CCUG 14189 / LMG 1036 / NCIMB 9965 / AN6) TaxID=406817 RepID=D3VID6_XENNA|nr:UmoD family flagellar biogenesis regulator [Xenorhabdus nematophila]CEE90210.1 putative UmoD [Xenorhabdus nematophila str. Anatoliense]CEF32452.1 putative UmoD [Xenorhabdus nematophila str. Websteri]AYA39943.1 UmoD [Xenorhabdus nematophila]MBA0018576.1 UmoD [Xenorhabdus nematophila]MCB4425720.1 UmoD [Xenorhabdus nematophila]
MVKIKIRQYIIGFIITIAIIGAAAFFFKSPYPNVAQVLSSNPIKSKILVHQSYCHITLFPTPVMVKDIEYNHLFEYEYRVLTLLDNLKIKKEYPALNHSSLKNCISIFFNEVRIVGYDVTYLIGENPGLPGKIRMPYAPESMIPLNEKGQLIISPHSGQ